MPLDLLKNSAAVAIGSKPDICGPQNFNENSPFIGDATLVRFASYEILASPDAGTGRTLKRGRGEQSTVATVTFTLD
jgi:hypothetical protein